MKKLEKDVEQQKKKPFYMKNTRFFWMLFNPFNEGKIGFRMENSFCLWSVFSYLLAPIVMEVFSSINLMYCLKWILENFQRAKFQIETKAVISRCFEFVG